MARHLLRLIVSSLRGRRRSITRAIFGFLVLLELRAYARYCRLCRTLASFRNPLGSAFARNTWRHFFVSRLRRELQLRPDGVRKIVQSLFWNVPLGQIGRSDLERCLRVTLSTQEDGERGCETTNGHPTIEQEARGLADEIGQSLKVEFVDGTTGCDFIRIESFVTNHAPFAPLFQPLPLRLLRSGTRHLADACMSALGFSFWRDEPTGIVYWCLLRPSAPRTVALYHGLGGNGLVSYLPLIWKMVRLYQGSIVVAEFPGMSGHPARCHQTLRTTPYPRADEMAASALRLKERVGTPVDGIGHSYGAAVLMYVQKYEHGVFDRIALLEPTTFFFHYSQSWPVVFRDFTLPNLCRALTEGRVFELLVCFIMAEPWTQHVLKQTVWFYEMCHWGPQQAGSDINTLVLLGKRDTMVDIDTLGWLRAEHPDMVVKTHDWLHGGVVLPWKAHEIATLLNDFFIIP